MGPSRMKIWLMRLGIVTCMGSQQGRYSTQVRAGDRTMKEVWEVQMGPNRMKNDLSDWVGIVTLVPNMQEFPRRCAHEDQVVMEVSVGAQL